MHRFFSSARPRPQVSHTQTPLITQKQRYRCVVCAFVSLPPSSRSLSLCVLEWVRQTKYTHSQHPFPPPTTLLSCVWRQMRIWMFRSSQCRTQRMKRRWERTLALRRPSVCSGHLAITPIQWCSLIQTQTHTHTPTTLMLSLPTPRPLSLSRMAAAKSPRRTIPPRMHSIISNESDGSEVVDLESIRRDLSFFASSPTRPGPDKGMPAWRVSARLCLHMHTHTHPLTHSLTQRLALPVVACVCTCLCLVPA